MGFRQDENFKIARCLLSNPSRISKAALLKKYFLISLRTKFRVTSRLIYSRSTRTSRNSEFTLAPKGSQSSLWIVQKRQNIKLIFHPQIVLWWLWIIYRFKDRWLRDQKWYQWTIIERRATWRILIKSTMIRRRRRSNQRRLESSK